jgi:hypothetical protein
MDNKDQMYTALYSTYDDTQSLSNMPPAVCLETLPEP